MKAVLSSNRFKIEDETNPTIWRLCCCWEEKAFRGCNQKKEVERADYIT